MSIIIVLAIALLILFFIGGMYNKCVKLSNFVKEASKVDETRVEFLNSYEYDTFKEVLAKENIIQVNNPVCRFLATTLFSNGIRY